MRVGVTTRDRAVFVASVATATHATFDDALALVRTHGFTLADLATDVCDRERLAREIGIWPTEMSASEAACRRFVAFVRARDPELAAALAGNDEEEMS